MDDPEERNSSPAAAITATPTDDEPYSIFDNGQRALIVLLASVAATFSGFASNIYFPALPTIADDFNVSSELVNLTVTAYLVFQGLAPSLWGPISDVHGRRVAYIGTFLVFLGACIGLALCRSYSALIVLRSLQSTGSSSTIAIGAGVVGDVTTRDNRGGLMGIFQAGLLVPVAIGPVIGGALAGSAKLGGWRSVFWFLAIYSGAFLIFLILLLPETLRAMVGNGGRAPRTLGPLARYPLRLYQKRTKTPWTPRPTAPTTPTTPAKIAKRASIDTLGPLRILASKQSGPIIAFLAVYYAVWQMSITALSTLLQSQYDLSVTQTGLTFIANGVGSVVGTLVTGKLLDRDYKKIMGAAPSPGQKNSSIRILEKSPRALEKARLRMLPLFAGLQCAAILVFGWTVDRHVAIAVPIIATFVMGWTVVSTQGAITTYLVDIHHGGGGGSATASLNLARCLLAAGGTSFVMPLIRRIGTGPAFTVCTGFQIVALAGLAVQWRYGAQWRMEAEAKKQRQQRQKEVTDADGELAVSDREK